MVSEHKAQIFGRAFYLARVMPERDVRDSAWDVRPWRAGFAAVRLAVGLSEASVTGRQGQHP